jgi:hypothetical protein
MHQVWLSVVSIPKGTGQGERVPVLWRRTSSDVGSHVLIPDGEEWSLTSISASGELPSTDVHVLIQIAGRMLPSRSVSSIHLKIPQRPMEYLGNNFVVKSGEKLETFVMSPQSDVTDEMRFNLHLEVEIRPLTDAR